MQTPGQQAEAFMTEAELLYAGGQFEKSHGKVAAALMLRRAVEAVPVPSEVYRDHYRFTDVMRRAFVLLTMLGKHEEAENAYQGARAWADEPECSSKRLFDAIESDYALRRLFSIAGNAKRAVYAPINFLFRRAA